MSFTPKAWQDAPNTSTPLSASALVDLETRLAAYADSVAVPGIGGEFFFHVEDYGAVGDCTNAGVGTDDQAAIMAAISACDAAGGGIVLFSAKYYKTLDTISTPPYSNVTLMGAGASKGYQSSAWENAATKIIAVGNTIKPKHVIEIGAGSSSGGGGGGSIVGIHVTSPSFGYKTGGAGVKITNGTSSSLSDVTTNFQYDGIIAGGTGEFCWALDWEKVWVLNSTRYGVTIGSGASAIGAGEFHARNLIISNVNYTYGSIGLYLKGSSGGWIWGADVLAFTVGVKIEDPANYWKLYGVMADTCTLPWALAGGDTMSYISCYAADNVSKAIGVQITGGQGHHWLGGEMSYFNTAAFDVSAGSAICIESVLFKSYSGITTTGNVIRTTAAINDLSFDRNRVGAGWTGAMDLAGNHTNLSACDNKGLASITYPTGMAVQGIDGTRRVQRNQVAGVWS